MTRDPEKKKKFDQEWYEKHREQRRKQYKDRVKRLRQSGLCKNCGQFSSIGNSGLCETCYYKYKSCFHFNSVKYWEDLKNLFERQERICPYSGIKLSPGIDAELDHTIPKVRGGENTLKNMQWVHKTVNKMKWDSTEEEFKEWIACLYNGPKMKEQKND